MVAMPTGTEQLRAFVKYEQPSFAELKRRFPLHVDADYEGARFYIKSGVIYKPVERKFWAVYTEPPPYGRSILDTEVFWQDMQVELERRGLRFAVYEELLAFAEKYPSEEGKFPVVAFGSSAKGQVPILECCGAGYKLRLRYYAKRWTGYQFLAARK